MLTEMINKITQSLEPFTVQNSPLLNIYLLYICSGYYMIVLDLFTFKLRLKKIMKNS